MNTKLKTPHKYLIFSFIMLIVFIYLFAKVCFAAGLVRVVVDGEEFTSSPEPLIENGRTLIPIRFISEKLGAEVIWDNEDRTVTIKKDDATVRLRIDSHLVMYENNQKFYELIDVAPRIIDNRTYVPLRLVSNALGVGIEWNQFNRTAYIDSNKSSSITPFFDIKIASVRDGQTISGPTKLQISVLEEYLNDTKHVKYMLLEPKSAEGFIIARGNNLKDEYTWIPDLKESGHKVLVAAIYDENGQFLAGDAVSVDIDVTPKVKLIGVNEGDLLDNVSLGVDINFISTKVEYEITNLNTGLTTIIGRDAPQDPYGKYNWEPQLKDNGNYSFKAIVYDTLGNTYESETINAVVEAKPKLSLTGIKNDQTIDKPVNLLASRNFDVKNTRYILIDSNTGEEHILMEQPYGSYSWFPGPEFKGTNEVVVEVEDSHGMCFRSEPITINIKEEPVLLLDGIGPNQVLTGSTSIKVRSNVNLDSVRYIINNQNTDREKVLAANEGQSFEQTYTPTEADIGYWTIVAVSEYKGNEIRSEEIPFRVFLGETYKPVSIVGENDYVNEFLILSSELAQKSWKDTGMSASLQVAQSILETGWGRSVPVDKYNGKISYNLFGIKGEGPLGSVTINTREVYNGNSYYIDANFRAYNSVEESWMDHKRFLLDSSRYEPFTKVMHDSIQGAWALKRSGYATDPEYAIKLMDIIDRYKLRELDKVRI